MKITMAHGSGGNATRELIGRIFARHFANPYLNKMDDAALLPALNQSLAMTTDSFVITPLFFPGGDIGKLAVYGTLNDLWMMGATPLYLTAGFILEAGLEFDTLERVVHSMALAAQETGVQIVAGDTKVVEGRGEGKSGLYINTAGLGCRHYPQEIGSARAQAGDLILLSGALGNHQACIYSQRMSIVNGIASDCGLLGTMVEKLLQAGLDVHVLRDVTRGGLATVLNEIAEASGLNLEINQAQIPVNVEVRGLCEILGLDPLYMANEGKMVCLIREKDAEAALDILRRERIGQEAALIGRAAVPSDRPQVILKTALGGRRIVEVLYGEGLPRIC